MEKLAALNEMELEDLILTAAKSSLSGLMKIEFAHIINETSFTVHKILDGDYEG